MTATLAPTARCGVPAGALRRSWLVKQLQDLGTGLELRRELAQLNRAAAAKVDFRNPQACLLELAREAAMRFPVVETYAIVNLIEPDEPDAWRDTLHYGIPCDVQGYHPEDGNHALDLAALDLTWWFERPEDLGGYWSKPETDALKRWWPGKPSEADAQRAFRHSGRRFAGVWAGLPDLMDYVAGGTNNGWLDSNFEDMDGAEMPTWTAAEIRSMEQGWKRAKPILDRVANLTNYINDDLPARLPILDKALRGDAAVIQRITCPVRQKTLAEIFSRKKNR